ncbi:CDK5 regulatory subunit-associated protein 1 [Trichinella papuae]|uniref:Fucosyltransferase n=1 Tax=Trichinella papuae TaxID=268474 RepID=A0A0V1N077_9BILA|nr:CDK5 regulatory subunit-associated protein 1 [Trichinella papuae]
MSLQRHRRRQTTTMNNNVNESTDSSSSLLSTSPHCLKTNTKLSICNMFANLLRAHFSEPCNHEFSQDTFQSILAHMELPEEINAEMKAAMQDRADLFKAEQFASAIKEDQFWSNNDISLVLFDLLIIFIRNGNYDSRLRHLLILAADMLGIRMEIFNQCEDALICTLEINSSKKTGDNNSTTSNKTEFREKSKKWKRALMIGFGGVVGGTLVGLTGGLATPLLAIGLASLSGSAAALGLATTAGAAVVGSIFGVAGAGWTGYKLKRRVGALEEFTIEILHYQRRSLHIALAVSGWITEDHLDSFKTPWRCLNVSNEQYCLRYESKYLLEFGKAIDYIFSVALSCAIQHSLMETALAGVMSAVVWPVSLLGVASVIDNPWNVCIRRSQEAGEQLSQILLSRQHGHRPVTLLGFSLGARVIYHCLLFMEKSGNFAGIVQNAILLGTPVGCSPCEWKKISQVVGGCIINGYCRSDWLLKFLYRTMNLQYSVAGLGPIENVSPRIQNKDLSLIVKSHSDYKNKLPEILNFVGIPVNQKKKMLSLNRFYHHLCLKQCVKANFRYAKFCIPNMYNVAQHCGHGSLADDGLNDDCRKIPYIENDDAFSGKGKKVYFETYGCQMNFNDVEIVRAILTKASFQETNIAKEADVVLLMTCAIRQSAEEKIWKRVKQLRKELQSVKGVKYCSPFIGILGCMAKRSARPSGSEIGLVDLIAGPDAYRDLPRLIASCETGQQAVNTIFSYDETYADIHPVRRDSSSQFAYLTIMRGCSNMCSYCIVPFTRGFEKSRPGVKEVTLLGQNVNSYCDADASSTIVDGQQYLASGFVNVVKRKNSGIRFAELLQRLSSINSNVRIRFTSPHPKDFPDEVLDVIRNHPNICNSVHLPAQSGSNNVLQRMHRGYTVEAYMNLVEKIKDKIPGRNSEFFFYFNVQLVSMSGVTLTSDFISGFCGETDEDHEQTVQLIKNVQYSYCYTFVYSMRERTKAHRRYCDDVPIDVKKARSQQLQSEFRKGALALNKTFIGKTLTVLVEKESKRSSEFWMGRSDGNLKIIFPKGSVNCFDSSSSSSSSSSVHQRNSKIGDFVAVDITDASSEVLKGFATRIVPLSHETSQPARVHRPSVQLLVMDYYCGRLHVPLKIFSLAILLLMTVIFVIIRDGRELFFAEPKLAFVENSDEQRQLEKLILLFISVGQPELRFTTGRQNCGLDYDCIASNDKRLFPLSSAVIFELRDVQLSSIFLPKRDDQVFIFYSREAPPQLFAPTLGVGNFFDHSVTYLPISWLHCPYGMVVKKKKKKGNSGEESIGTSPFQPNRTRLAFWIASKCSSHSGREWLVQRLAQYVPIDTYGACGTLPLARAAFDHDRQRSLAKLYKFRIVFENTVCRDYMTERFFEALIDGSVPVVLRRADYESIAPEHSFIAADDFSSAKQLADYLNYLDKNTEQYAKYFHWTQLYSVELVRSCVCELCLAIKEKSRRRTRDFNNTNNNFYQWWNEENDCQYDFASHFL